MIRNSRTIWQSIAAFLLLLAVTLPGIGRAESAELIMLEKQLCEWCERWNEEIAEVYPKTWEGRAAPLRRVDIFADRPGDLADIRWSRFTPTFIVLVDGREIGRITGYAGEDFFWGLLDDLLNQAGVVEPQS